VSNDASVYFDYDYDNDFYDDILDLVDEIDPTTESQFEVMEDEDELPEFDDYDQDIE